MTDSNTPQNSLIDPKILANQSLKQLTLPSVFKVLILGAESTGKTTLCKDLAAHFDTTWAGEYMRPYLQQKWDDTQTSCEWQDLMPIAYGQVAHENTQTERANRYLFCDTSLFEIMVYSYWYYNTCPEPLETAALTHHYDLILLTEVDVPWEPDDLRDAPHQRHEISQTFADTLIKYNKPFRRIGGNRQQRVQQVAQWLHELNP